MLLPTINIQGSFINRGSFFISLLLQSQQTIIKQKKNPTPEAFTTLISTRWGYLFMILKSGRGWRSFAPLVLIDNTFDDLLCLRSNDMTPRFGFKDLCTKKMMEKGSICGSADKHSSHEQCDCWRCGDSLERWWVVGEGKMFTIVTSDVLRYNGKRWQ